MKVIHIKTGNVYVMEEQEAINATNDNDGQVMVVYRNEEGHTFVREKREFWNKFEIKGR